MMLPYLATALLILVTVYSAMVSFRQKREGAGPSWIFPDGVRPSTRIVAGAATVIFIFGLITWSSTGSRSSPPRSFRFLIPENYTGWVRVEFEVAGEEALAAEAGQTVLKIPPSGRLRTSSPEQYGWARDSYFYYSDAGARALADSGAGRMIWGKINGEASGSSGKRKYEEFFVGTEQQFKEQAKGEKKGAP